MACALSLFGGTRKKKPGGSYKRGDIHVLFVGDPGTGKSEVLKGTVELSPRGLYTSGKGSTAVGLTAAVIKDAETGQMNLEAGAIVLANGGVAAIDEFDKMDSADRSALHEGMEQQTVSIAKAGIVATLKAETAVIAAANPYSGRYDIYKTPTQNIRLPPSLLSRFDLIFVIVDRPNKADDAQMAEFILQNAMSPSGELNEEQEEESIAPISGDLLKKYIKHAKRSCKPVLTIEAKEKIKDFYLELRGEYDSEDAIVSILARNLDALVRLSEAHAKMALRSDVLKEDVEEIIILFKRYLRDTGYDETTGKIDMDRIFVGQSRSILNKTEKLLDRLKEIFEENGWKALEKKSIIQILELEESFDKEFIEKALNEFVKEGTLYEPKVNYIKFTNQE
ncbi:MAG: minichromosome maintenance protein MCM [Candidatus Lokiarchaeota archaeon]